MKCRYEIFNNQVIFSDGTNGSILLKDEQWYPFRFFDDGDLDILDNDDYAFLKPSTAYEFSKKYFT